MFQVKVVASGDGESVEFGPVVESLEQASAIVKFGDQLFDHVCQIAGGLESPLVPEGIKVWEGSDIYVVEKGTDKMWFAIEDHNGNTVWEVVR
jgi:hypothetical protein